MVKLQYVDFIDRDFLNISTPLNKFIHTDIWITLSSVR